MVWSMVTARVDTDHVSERPVATITGTNNLLDWDAGAVRISVRARGLEETAVLDLISPPAGAHLLSAVGDVGGFRHTDFTKPGPMFANPTLRSTTGLDYAELAPPGPVRVGNGHSWPLPLSP